MLPHRWISFSGPLSRKYDEPCVMGEESIMSPKSHGTSEVPVQQNLRWNCDYETADRSGPFIFSLPRSAIRVVRLLH